MKCKHRRTMVAERSWERVLVSVCTCQGVLRLFNHQAGSIEIKTCIVCDDCPHWEGDYKA